MKRILLIAIALTLLASPAIAGTWAIFIDTLGCYTRSDAKLFRHIIKEKDTPALIDLVERGRCTVIKKGTKVTVVEEDHDQMMDYARVRGSARTMWFLLEHLTVPE